MAMFVRSGTAGSLAPQAYFETLYNPVGYRDASLGGRGTGNNLLPLSIPTPPTFPIGAAWLKCLQYNTGAAYIDTSPVGWGDNAFLPKIIQCNVQSLLGAPFDQKPYRDLSYFTSDNAFLPNIIQCKVQSYLGAPFNPGAYQDLTAPRAHAFLPSVIQCQVSSLLGIPFNPVAYQDQTAPRAHAFLPNTIQCRVNSLLGAPFATGDYRDQTAPRAHAFLPSTIQCQVNSLLGAPYNSQQFVYGNLPYNLAIYSAAVVQAPFFNQWWPAYSPQAFGFGYTSWASLAQNSPPIPGTPVKAGTDYNVDAAPFNPQAFAPGITWFNIQTQAPIGPAPFFNNLFWTAVVAPYNTQDYRDRTGAADQNAFLPNTIQCGVQSLLGVPFDPKPSAKDAGVNAFLPVQIQTPIAAYGTVTLTWAPFNSGDYRDRTYDASQNAFLPDIIQTPQSTFLNYIENIAPFDTRSYRDLHIFFNPVALKPVPINRPTPVVPYDPLRFSQTPLVNNLIYGLSAPLPPQATRLNFIENITPFNQGAFRDLSLSFNINLNAPFSVVPDPAYIVGYPGPFYAITFPPDSFIVGGPPTTRKLQ